MKEIPVAPGHWLLGNAYEMRLRPHRFAAETGLRHGGMARLRILHRRLIAVTHPDLIREVLITRHERYERSFHYKTTQQIVGRGLIATDGPYWKMRRRQVQPAFRPEHLSRLVPAVNQASDEMFARWDARRAAGEPVPLVEDMQALTLTIMCRALLSVGIELEMARAIGAAVREGLFLIRSKNTSLCPVPHWVPSRTNLGLRKRRDVLDTFVGGHLRARLEPGAAPRQDLAQALLDARDPETGESLPWQSLLDEAKTLIAAGFETTATTLAWALHRLSHHPEVAETWHAEIDRVLGDRPPTWDDLSQLGFTERIFNETMRLYPPVYSLGRTCQEDDVLGGCRIRRGETLLLSVYGAHRMPEYWPDPERFDPERFSPGRIPPKHTFMPFALGKHTCVGMAFGLAEATLVLARIGQRYRLAATRPLDVPVRAQVTLLPAAEIPVRLEARR